MKVSKIEVDDSGRLAGPGIHDAIVDGFRFSDRDAFDVCICSVGGESQLISLRDVRRLGMRDVVNGTIISDIYCWALDGLTTIPTVTDDAWRTLLAGNYIEKDLHALINNLTMQFSDCVLVFIESSYGGSIAAICHEIYVDSSSGRIAVS
jgi:hypothetical protein